MCIRDSFNIVHFLATAKFDAAFVGRASHAGAFPEYGKNALLAAVAAAANIAAIPRHSEGASRVNVGYLQAGTGRNVVPERAYMQIETRGATSGINAHVRARADRILEGAAHMYDCALEITEMGGAPGASNSPALAQLLAEINDAARVYSDVAACEDLGASDDFSYYMERVQQLGGQGAYIFYGGVNNAVHHNPLFSVDEASMANILRFLSAAVPALLRRKGDPAGECGLCDSAH